MAESYPAASARNSATDPSPQLSLLRKHAPRTFQHVMMPEMLRTRFQNILSSGTVPNILLYGPHGVGKTLVFNLMLRDLGAAEVLRINGADNGGHDAAIGRLHTFCKKLRTASACPKIVMVDNADRMSAKTQLAIAAAMDEFAAPCRFLFTGGSLEGVSELVQSRCNIYHMPAPSRKDVVRCLRDTCAKESITHEGRSLELIAVTAKGDVRRALNLLDVIAMTNAHLSEEVVMRFSHMPPSILVNRIVQACIDMDLDRALGCVDALYEQGYSAHDIVQSMIQCMTDTSFELEVKHAFLAVAHDTFTVVNKVENDQLQLLGCIARMIKLAGSIVHRR